MAIRSSNISIAAVAVIAKLVLVAPIALGVGISEATERKPAAFVGCLQPGSEKGSFILKDVTTASTDRVAADHHDDLPVLSTVVPLTGHLGHRIWIKGQHGTNKRFGPVFKIHSVKMLEGSCR